MATYITRTLAQNSNSGKMTLSYWVKRSKLGEQALFSSYYSGTYFGKAMFNSDDQLYLFDYRAGYVLNLLTTMKFRDTNAWYHIVQNFDHTTNPTTAKIYVNGVEATLTNNTLYSQGATSSWLTDYPFYIGQGSGLGSVDFEGYLSDVYFIQGQAYSPSTFGEFDSNGVWKPKTEVTVDYSSTGNNSFHLKFENSSNMDLDSGDNNVTFSTTGNLTQTVDTPSNVYATFNPLNIPTSSQPTFSNGNNTVATSNGASAYFGGTSTLGVDTGKWYTEFKVSTISGEAMMGITATPEEDARNQRYPGQSSLGWGYFSTNGNLYNNASSTAYGSSYTTGDIIGVAMDLDNNALYFSKNGTWQNSGDPTSGATKTGAISITSGETYFFAIGDGTGAASSTIQANFGNGYFGTTAVSSAGSNGNGAIFEYDVPTGFYALNTKNIAQYG